MILFCRRVRRRPAPAIALICGRRRRVIDEFWPDIRRKVFDKAD